MHNWNRAACKSVLYGVACDCDVVDPKKSASSSGTHLFAEDRKSIPELIQDNNMILLRQIKLLKTILYRLNHPEAPNYDGDDL